MKKTVTVEISDKTGVQVFQIEDNQAVAIVEKRQIPENLDGYERHTYEQNTPEYKVVRIIE